MADLQRKFKKDEISYLIEIRSMGGGGGGGTVDIESTEANYLWLRNSYEFPINDICIHL